MPAYCLLLTVLWCERGDSNPHTFRYQILSLARLPIPPLSQLMETKTRIAHTSKPMHPTLTAGHASTKLIIRAVLSQCGFVFSFPLEKQGSAKSREQNRFRFRYFVDRFAWQKI